MSLRVLLADDQLAVRSALRLILEHEPNVEVVGEVAQAERLLAEARLAQPDVLLLDWELPGLAAAEVLPALRSLCPDCAVVALSGYPEACDAALATGARAFVSKGDPPDQLLGIIRAWRGGACLDRASPPVPPSDRPRSGPRKLDPLRPQ